MAEDRMLSDEILLGLIKANSGGGGGGTSNYNDLSNKPQIGGVTLSGNKSASDLGLVAAVDGKGLSTNDYTDADKAIVGGVTAALAGKQDVLTAGNNIKIDDDTISVNRWFVPAGKVVYTVITSDENYGQNIHIQRHTTGGDFIDDRVYTVATWQRVTIDGLIYIEERYTKFYIELLKNSDEQSAGYSYIVDPNTASTSNSFTFLMEQEENDNDLIIRSELDAKQNTLTFDDTPTDNSNNPVKSNGIYDALALKQNATDNSLDTTAKTIVGAINEHEGDISSLMSGFTNLDNEVNGDATVYPYADVITIEDAVPANLADCSVKIEPVQDLHGQSAPYVGGAYKNKLELTVDGIKAVNTSGTWSGNAYTHNGVTYNLVTDAANNITSITANNTASDDAILYIPITMDAPFVANGCQNAASDSTYYMVLNIGGWYSANRVYGTDKSFDTGSAIQAALVVAQGYTANNLTFYPMVSADGGAFAPYTNICPISGHIEVDVQRDGVNLFESGNSETVSGIVYTKNADGSFTVSGTRNGSNAKSLGDAYVTSAMGIVNVSVSGTYQNLQLYTIRLKDANGTEITSKSSFGNIDLSAYPTIEKISIEFKGTTDGAVASGTLYPMVVIGETATPYEPYAGKTYTIALGDTAYGDIVEFNTGIRTVVGTKYKMLSTDITNASGSFAGRYFTGLNFITDVETAQIILMCDAFNAVHTGSSTTVGDCYVTSNGNISFNTSFESLSDFQTYLDNNDVYVIIPVSTPTTIQLTPQQIQLLKGTNTLYASTGDISVTVNGVSGTIGAVQEQVNATDAVLAELAADIAEQLPDAPTTDGAYVLTVTVADGTPTYSWESAT